MKKNIFKLICFLFLFSFGIRVVNAEYECNYKINYTDRFGMKYNTTFTIKYDDAGTPSVVDSEDCGGKLALGGLQCTIETNIKEDISLYTIKDKKLIGRCPSALTLNVNTYKLFLTNSECKRKANSECTNLPYIGGGSGIFNQACHQINLYQIGFEDSIKEYDDCDGEASCQSSKLGKVKDSEDLLKSYCRTIVSNYSYDGSSEEECIKSCLDIDTIIRNKKEQVGILKNGSGDCGFSGRLLVWLNNIMRWIKYILPVIVILLGIIDFIKAVAADKEDEMKKAQGRFVKRLISAAIVFLVPLLIEFILNVMGFKYDSCSLF